MDCNVDGDSDLYGLGARLGQYLSGVSCILTCILRPERTGGVVSGLLIQAFVLILGLLKNVLQGRPAMLEMYIVFELVTLLISMLSYSGAMLNSLTSVAATILVITFQMFVSLWVGWKKRFSGFDNYPPGCARTVRFFGAVDISGPFGTYLTVMSLMAVIGVTYLLLALLVSFVVRFRESHNFLTRCSYKCKKAGIWARGKLQKYPHLPVMTQVISLAVAIGFAEDTLRLSYVKIDSNLLSTGQLLPLVIGSITVLGVFTDWLCAKYLVDEQGELDSLAEQYERARQAAQQRSP